MRLIAPTQLPDFVLLLAKPETSEFEASPQVPELVLPCKAPQNKMNHPNFFSVQI